MKRILSMLLTVILCLFIPFYAQAKSDYNADKIKSIALGIVNWKKDDLGAKKNGNLINNNYLELAGTTPGDWYQIGMSRLGIDDDYDGYLAVIKNIVKERYKSSSKLSSVKATEWHRISLAVLACGGDPKNLCLDKNGKNIDLIADGTYNRGYTASLGKQGINGFIWGLISLDSMQYEVPKNAFYTRDNIIVEILKQQLSDGGFALSGKNADPDITSMALQALAPYYNDNKEYEYKLKTSQKTVNKTVREVIDESIECLSKMQLDSGDYFSWGTQNVESTCQVVVALCSLGINPQTDKRYIKKGNTLIDGILKYKMADGGFVHSYTYDSDNPSSKPDKSNSMAGEQTLYTMAAIVRNLNFERNLYDFRTDFSKNFKKRISELQEKIKSSSNDKKELEKLLKMYYAIPKDERFYVRNFNDLYDKAIKNNIDLKSIEKSTKVVFDNENNSNLKEIEFTENDKNSVNNLPKKLTTKEFVSIVKLLDKLENSSDFDEKEVYKSKLQKAKHQVEKIQKEIDEINLTVKKELYPLDKMGLSNKKTIDNIVKRIENLSDYDKTKIENYEDVVKTKTKVDNELRAVIIMCLCAVIIAVLAVFIIYHIKSRKNKKIRELEELAKEFEDEE